jgi:hypothetical protein
MVGVEGKAVAALPIGARNAARQSQQNKCLKIATSAKNAASAQGNCQDEFLKGKI